MDVGAAAERGTVSNCDAGEEGEKETFQVWQDCSSTRLIKLISGGSKMRCNGFYFLTAIT